MTSADATTDANEPRTPRAPRTTVDRLLGEVELVSTALLQIADSQATISLELSRLRAILAGRRDSELLEPPATR